MNWQEFFLAQSISTGIQAVLGLIATAIRNPESKTFKRFAPALRNLRDALNFIDLGDDLKITPGKPAAN